jgi:hypothetical protein
MPGGDTSKTKKKKKKAGEYSGSKTSCILR